jgi:crotonobetainyl-CoA:carnitine CoA-transferase CaiB-like acyl-CoA transferase
VRAENAEAMYPLITQWTMEHTKAEIMDRCQAEGCPTTAILSMDEAAGHPHLRERGYMVELEHPLLGSLQTLGPPFRLPESPGGARRPPPALGQDNEAILNQLQAPSEAAT